MAASSTFHQNLIEKLHALLRKGKFGAGDRFLTEREIAAKYHTSRPTANKALSSLVSAGLLEVRRGAGTFVRESVLDYNLERLVSFTDKARSAGRTPGTKLLVYREIPASAAPKSVTESLRAAEHDTLIYLERIRLALERREFVMHYQPKVNMHSGQVIGAEALIRWQHPEKGLLAPGTFLPVIEGHALAVEVGEWVIDTALTQIEVWRTVGLDLSVSVNIGARQLQQGDFVHRLQAILAQHPLVKPTSLELEVLETSALEDMAKVSQVIEDCNQLGVIFALDDFGTGYSSLTYLKRLHVAQLKIDQSFVRDMLVDQEDLAILEGVIGLAAAFKREVIAEGVETVEHGTALLHLGCELAQGYGIARPMPAEQLPTWAATWQPDAVWRAVPIFGETSRPTKE